MTRYLIDIYGNAKDFEETKIDNLYLLMTCKLVKQWANSYTVRVELKAVNGDGEINYQLWEGLFKNKRWFRVLKLDESGEAVAQLDIMTDKFIELAH